MDQTSTPANANLLHVRLLGSPTASWAGDVVDIPRRLVRAMLFYLAAQATPTPREHLCFLFWPDISDTEARRNLTRTLTHLRRALPHPAMLIADEDRLYLDASRFTSDVLELNRQDPQAGPAATFQRFLDLYHGPFLSGFYLPDSSEFEHWAAQERSSLEDRYLLAIQQLLTAAAAARDYPTAVHLALRYLQTDPLAEAVHRQLMLMYASDGDRARALRQYETCLALLERELGVAPLPETQAVYRAILEGQLPLARPEPVEPALITDQAQRLDIPMIGRLPAVRSLDEALQKVVAGDSQVVLVSGEPGIGKTRLLFECARRYRSQHALLYCAGQPGEQSVPYHPIVEALRLAPAGFTPDLSEVWLAEVSRLLPEINAQHPHLPHPLNLRGEEARIRLFEALSRYLFALQAETGPLLLFMDDLHWFDRTSLSWLAHLCRQLPQQNRQFLLVGAYRSEDALQVRELRQNLSRLALLDEIYLEGLDCAGVLELVGHAFDRSAASEAFASRLRDVTGGNPFFIIETLQALREQGLALHSLQGLDEFPLPEGVRQAVNRRLERLNAEPRQVLEAGAVLGPLFDLEPARQTAGKGELETSHCLEQLVSRQLLVEQDYQFRFSHELIRRVTLAAVNPVRLRILHGRAGKALEKLQPEAIASMAQHFEAAGDLPKALHYRKLCADRAESLFALEETEFHLKRILDDLSRLAPLQDQPTHLEHHSLALSRLVRLYYLQGRLEQRDAFLEQLSALAGRSGDARVGLQFSLAASQQAYNDARYPETILAAEKGLLFASQLRDPSTRCRLLVQIGLAHYFLGRPEQALDVLGKAQASNPGASKPELRAGVLDAIAQVHRMIGNYQQALDHSLEAFRCRQQLGDQYSEARYVDIGFLYIILGQFQPARQFLERSLAQARKVGVPIFEAHALLAWGAWYLYQRESRQAVETLRQALDLLGTLRNQNLSASTMASLGFAYFHLDDLAQGREWLECSLALSRSIGHRMRIAQVLIQLALLEIACGNLPAARDKLHEGLAIAGEIQCGDLLAAGMVASASLERHAADYAAASQAAGAALRQAQALRLSAVEVWARVEAGLSAVHLGEFAEAAGHTRLALDLAAQAHQLWLSHAQVRQAHATVLAAQALTSGDERYIS